MALVGKNSEKNNQNLMQLIRRAHGLVENPDLEKHRQSQDHIGELLGNSKEIQYRPVDIDGMDAEWVSVNRAHMKKYVILHCHGGGYSTGSSIYARTLTSKLAAGTSMDVLCFDYRLAPEHPYPAAAEDAMKAWNYLMLLGYGARDVIITGDSAGGNLALSLVLKLKEQERLLLSLLLCLRGRWHCSSTYLDGVFMGARNRVLPTGTELERLPLPRQLQDRLQTTMDRLRAID